MSAALPDLSSLTALARDQNIDVRPVILRVQTDLFATARSRDRAMITAFEALALGLLPVVDDATAAIVARKLAPLADTPASVLGHLASRGGEVEKLVTELVPTLSDETLAAALTGGGEQARAVAARASLDEATIVRLLSLEDEEIDLRLALNAKAELAGHPLDRLVERARSRPALARTLLRRDDLADHHQAALYLHADSDHRARIRALLAAAPALSGQGERFPRIDAAGRARLSELAHRGEASEFGAHLAALFGMDPCPDWQFQAPGRHELLVLALLAAGMGEEECIRILLTLHDEIARSVRTVFHLADIARSVPRSLAVRLVEATLGVSCGARRGGRFIPAMAPGGTPSRGLASRLASRDQQARPGRPRQAQ